MIYVDDKSIAWHDNMTVAQLIEALGETYAYPAVRINKKIIPRPQFDRFIVPDEAKVYLIPLVAGG